MKTGILGLFLLTNTVALFCALNFWTPNWQQAGITVLVIEVVFLLLIGLPLFLHQMIWKRKSSLRLREGRDGLNLLFWVKRPEAMK